MTKSNRRKGIINGFKCKNSKSQEKSEKEQATASTHKPVRERVDLREERKNHFIGRARQGRGQMPTAPKKQAEGKSLGK